MGDVDNGGGCAGKWGVGIWESLYLLFNLAENLKMLEKTTSIWKKGTMKGGHVCEPKKPRVGSMLGLR